MLTNRMKSEKGATILIALLFFLLCAVAGSVVLAAGTGASGRVSNLVTDEQSYYSATSAARMFKTEIMDKTFDCVYNSKTDEYTTTVTEGKSDTNFDKFLKDNALTVFKVNQEVATTLPSKDLTITPSSSAGEENIKDVTSQFTMDKNYNISVSFNCGDFTCYVSGTATFINDKKQYKTTLADGSTQIETNLTWTDVRISKQMQ